MITNSKRWEVPIYGYDLSPPKYRRAFKRVEDGMEWVDTNGGAITFRKLANAKEIKFAWAYSDDTDYIIQKSPKALLKLVQKPSYIRLISPGMLEWLIQQAKDAYYNTAAPLMDDAIYDRLEDRLKKLYPKSPVLRTGSAPQEQVTGKVTLPYYMGSLDKIKSGVENWGYPGPYLITEKLDGVSVLYTNEKGICKLYTRGNGIVGQDVSHLCQPLGLPGIPNGWAVRGELIMPEIAFQKYSAEFKNPRNMMSGLVNSKRAAPALVDSRLVAFELLNPRRTFSQALKSLKSKGFNVPWHQQVNTLDSGVLTDLLISRKSKSKFALDGLVVYDDNRHETSESGNPPWAFAFKSIAASDKVIATVTGIEWNTSKHGQLKPVVQFDPVQLSGVSVSRATGHHAKYIQDNSIGIGAKIEITRSGDVIPYILKVVKKAKRAAMPEEYNWDWDSTSTNAIVRETNDSQAAAQLLAQFRNLGIEKIGKGKVANMVASGYTNIDDLANAEDAELVDMLGPKLARTYHDMIWNALVSADHVALMMASGLFPMGIGKRKLTSVLETYPDITTKTPQQLIRLASSPPAQFSAGSFKQVLDIIPEYVAWIEGWELGNKPHRTAKTKQKSSKLSGNVYLFTGVRDKDLEAKLVENGATVAGNFSSKVTHLVAKSVHSLSSKAQKARDAGIPILDIQQLRSQFV